MLTIFISKKYPRIGFLELYKIIKKRLIKRNFSFLYNSSILKNKYITPINTNKNEIFIGYNRSKRELSKLIKTFNEINLSHQKHYFESKFNQNSNKYENCFIKNIDCNKKNSNKLNSSKISKMNKKEFSSSSLKLSISSYGINKNINNKIRFFSNLSFKNEIKSENKNKVKFITLKTDSKGKDYKDNYSNNSFSFTN